MTLQILIPQYLETEDVLKPMLDSIALQQNISFNDIGVIICNDGSDIMLNRRVLDQYPFQVQYFREEHNGVSATRNACLDYATADYVMFCDADDMFFNACGLYIIFREIQNGGFDTLVSIFVEESRNRDTNEIVYFNHEMDSTFVHGKVFRRQYLIDNNIRWNNSLTIHEDSYFNILCQNLSSNVKYCQTAFYLWKWRDNSVCRHDPKYILKTYRNMIDSNDALIDAFLMRGKMDRAAFYTALLVFDAYYMMNKPEWIKQTNRSYRNSTEIRFAKYFRKRRDLWNKVPDNDKMIISNQVRSRSIGEGMLMEAVTVDAWLRHIEKLGMKRN